LCTLGFASHLDNADTDARAMFNRSLAIAQSNGDHLMVAYAHLGLALIASRAGDAHTAATLHGAADAIQNKLGTHFDSLESGLRDADLTRLRAALGETAFQTAYNAGHASDIPAAAARHEPDRDPPVGGGTAERATGNARPDEGMREHIAAPS
jgi:hypothetical protein